MYKTKIKSKGINHFSVFKDFIFWKSLSNINKANKRNNKMYVKEIEIGIEKPSSTNE